MNKIGIYAYFEKVPSSQQKEEIQAKLTSFLLKIQDDPKNIIVTCGEGSWWITFLVEGIIPKVGNWVIPEFMSWSVNKCFDKVAEFISKKRAISESESRENSLSADIQQSRSCEVIPGISGDTIRQCMSLKNSLGANELNIIEWSDSQGLGRSISITETQDGTSVTLIQIDSEKKFDDIISRHK